MKEFEARGIQPILKSVADWASQHQYVIGVALVGSYARGNAHPNSDIDIVLIVRDIMLLWDDPDWHEGTLPAWSVIKSYRDADYGIVRSRHLELDNGPEVELAVAPEKWIATPVDDGTRRVVARGFVPLFDPQHALRALALACATADP